MSKKFSDAIDELESEPSSQANDFKSRLERELHRMEEAFSKIRPHLDDLGDKVSDQAKKARDKVEDKVVENPWAALGIVGLVFFILGFLFASRRSD